MPKLTAQKPSKKTSQVVQWAEALAQLVKDSGMAELHLEQGEQSIRMRRSDGGPVAATTPAPSAPRSSSAPNPQDDDWGTPVNSRYVGVFRSRHPKTNEPMVSPHDVAETNQVLGWVECMGIRHEVVAPRAGTVSEVLVDDAEPVEFGQVLLVIQ